MNTRWAKNVLCIALSLPLCSLTPVLALEADVTADAQLQGSVRVDAVKINQDVSKPVDATPASAHAPVIDGLFEAIGELDFQKEARIRRSALPQLLHGAGSAAMSLANFVFDLRGFDYSVEGADAALNSDKHHVIARSDGAKEFEARKKIDAAHMKIVSGVLQMAEGLGGTDARSQKLVADAQKSLSEILGADRAANVLDVLSKCKDSAYANPLVGEAWDMEQKTEKLETMAKAAVMTDPVVEDIRHRLGKYNRSKAARYAAKTVYSVCNIAEFTPTLAAPAGNIAFLVYMMMTGGPEQDKLLKEIYLAKCLDSRTNLLTEQSHMVVESYHVALLKKNPLLLSVSESLLKQMSGQECVAQVFGNTDTISVAKTTQPVEEKKTDSTVDSAVPVSLEKTKAAEVAQQKAPLAQ